MATDVATNGQSAETTEAPQTTLPTFSLSDRAVIYRLHAVNMWNGKSKDRRLTEEVISAHDMSDDAGHWSRNLVPKDFFKDLRSAWTAMKAVHQQYTLPWEDVRGGRICAIDALDMVEDRIKAAAENFATARVEVIRAWPDMVAERMRDLKDSFDITAYAPHTQLDAFWRYETLVQPVPSDWRTDLPATLRERYEQRWASYQERQIAQAMRDPFMCIHGAITTMIESLRKYQSGGQKTIHRTTLYDNIDAVVSVLGVLNITGDEALTALEQRVRRDLLAFDPEIVQQSAPLQNTVLSRADDILADLSAYIGAEASESEF